MTVSSERGGKSNKGVKREREQTSSTPDSSKVFKGLKAESDPEMVMAFSALYSATCSSV